MCKCIIMHVSTAKITTRKRYFSCVSLGVWEKLAEVWKDTHRWQLHSFYCSTEVPNLARCSFTLTERQRGGLEVTASVTEVRESILKKWTWKIWTVIWFRFICKSKLVKNYYDNKCSVLLFGNLSVADMVTWVEITFL